MDETTIHSTEWAKQFQRECWTSYNEAVKHASNPNLKVSLDRNNEIDINSFEWAIVVEGTDFWMDTKKTKSEAVALCKKMGWNIVT